MTGRDEGFLTRWSRRKRTEPAEEADPAAGADERPAEPPQVETETEEEVLERLGLPDPDSLKPGDDFAAFMKAAVPEALRRRALRRLWRSNPVLANLDGLNDYDGDFTGGGLPRGELKTLYEVGRGFLARDKPDPSPAEAEIMSSADPAPSAETGDVEKVQNDAKIPEPEEDGQETQENSTGATRRRMTFRFSDQ